LNSNPPIFTTNYSSELDAINNDHGIYIYYGNDLLSLLADIEPHLCANYLYIPLDEWTRLYAGLIMRKERVDLLESMNVIVAERMSFVDDYVQTLQMKEECRQHIFPVYTPDPKYSPLQLVKINGAFAFLFTFLCLAIGLLLFEIISSRYINKNDTKKSETYNLHIQYDKNLSTEVQHIVTTKYLEILGMLSNNYFKHEINICYDDTLAVDARQIIEQKYIEILDAIKNDSKDV
jgi:hypothetical protein